MTSEIDIYRAANELVRQHGDEAPIHAAMRADALADASNLDGYAVWKQIMKAIEVILSGAVTSIQRIH